MLTMNDAQWSIMLISDCSFILSWHLRFPISGRRVWPRQFRPEDNRFGKKRRRCNWGRKNTRNNWHLSIFIIRIYQGGDMGKEEVHQPRSVVCPFLGGACGLCMRYVLYVSDLDTKLPRDTVRHGRTALALLHCWAVFRHTPMNASRFADSLWLTEEEPLLYALPTSLMGSVKKWDENKQQHRLPTSFRLWIPGPPCLCCRRHWLDVRNMDVQVEVPTVSTEWWAELCFIHPSCNNHSWLGNL